MDRYPFAIGSYLIAIAFMDVIPLPNKPLLKDYVHPEVVGSNSDCDIIEGPSRISLSCPISRTRIKLPVKGHVCKHLQVMHFLLSISKDRMFLVFIT
jgi:E3 SUMO-protein ligase PIAS1